MAKKTTTTKPKPAPKSRKPAKLSDQLRQIIHTCGVSRYRIAKDLGMTQSMLSYFVNGQRGLSVEAIDALGEYLDLEVVMRSPKRS